MKVAIPWSIKEHLHYGDEYNIDFNADIPKKFELLFSFLQEHKDIRFNINIISEEGIDFEKLKVITAAHDKIYFRITNDKRLYELLKKNNMNFFFDSTYAANCFRLLEEQLQLGATDVYISDDLCYNLENVRKICDKYGAQVRMILNHIPSRRFDKEFDIRSPWFIPECVDELSKYIDVAEFDCKSWLEVDTYYQIWFKKRKWRENLRYIYKDMQIDIPNQSLIPNFLESKMNCGYKCSYGSSCKKCNQFVEIARDLFNKKIEYVIE